MSLNVKISPEAAEALQALIGTALDNDHEAEGIDPDATLAARHEIPGMAELLAEVAKATREATYGPVADRMTAIYEPRDANPQEIGAADGSEDDFGDLISEIMVALGLDHDNGDLYELVSETASASTATDMLAFIAEIDITARRWLRESARSPINQPSA